MRHAGGGKLVQGRNIVGGIADCAGTKLPGGVMVPIVMQKKNAPKAGDTKDPGPICSIQ